MPFTSLGQFPLMVTSCIVVAGGLVSYGSSAETATARFHEYSLELPLAYVQGNGRGEMGPEGVLWKHSEDTISSPGVKLTVMPRIRYLRGADAGYDALLPVGELSIAELRKGSKPFTFESREVKIQGVPAVLTSFAGRRGALEITGVSLVFVNSGELVNVLAMAFGPKGKKYVDELEPHLLAIKYPAAGGPSRERPRPLPGRGRIDGTDSSLTIGDTTYDPSELLSIDVRGLHIDYYQAVLVQLWPDKAPGNFSAQTADDGITFRIKTDEDVREVAKRVKFGEVLRIEDSPRAIVVQGDASKLDRHMTRDRFDSQKPGFFEKHLATIEGRDRGRGAAVASLVNAGPENADKETRKRVALAMRDVALNPQRSSHNTQAVAVKGLRVWAGKYAVPVLLDILSKESLARVHGEALHELAELRDPSAIEPLAKYLANNEPVFVLGVLDCLAAHGPAAEPAILDNFPTNIDVVSHAVDILGSIGTHASLTKFEAIKKDETYRELWSKVEYFTRKLRERQ